MTAKIKLGIIIGSARPVRFADKIVKWAEKLIAVDGRYAVTIIDARALGMTAWHEDMLPDKLAELRADLGAADAFLIVTPEFNHSFPASLKSLIDAGKAEWEAKPVAFLSYGGISGGLRAVEGLRLVLAELHAVTLRDSVSFAMPFQRFSDDGVLSDPAHAESAMAMLLNRLNWWSGALNGARIAQPYASSIA